AEGRSGLLNAATGTGKTYAIWGGVVNAALRSTDPTRSSPVIPALSRNRGDLETDLAPRDPESHEMPGQARHDKIRGGRSGTTGLKAIWITPLRSLAGEIADSARRMCEGVGLDWRVGLRTGDTSTKERAAQKKAMPQLLVTTPESLHVLLASKGADKLFAQLDWFVADEWHELLGSKRGVQV
ncbi:MAG: DEAD/DEAH box helicase, partial [Flavobacteriales bacterium]|nr:DEAD/DEAH box helicase [Flavobacteriales bacterium]